MSSRPMPEWCADCGEIARLLRWLHATDGIDVAICIDIVSKPWHWDDEYQQMCAAQERPTPRRIPLEEEEIEISFE